MQNSSAGVYIITAAGDGYLEEAISLAERINDIAPDVPIAIATDGEVPDSLFHTVIPLENPDYSTLDKTSLLGSSPFEKTLYLDTDVYVVDKAGLSDIFELLDRFDFAAAHDPGRNLYLTRYYSDSDGLPDVDVPNSFAWYNGGVLAYRNSPAVQEVLGRWNELHRKHMTFDEIDTMDQAALQQALYESDLRIATLPPEYNFYVGPDSTVAAANQYAIDDIHIVHGRFSNIGDVAEFINQQEKTHPETYFVTGKGAIRELRPATRGKWRARWERLRLVFRTQGPVTTLRRLVRWVREGEF